MNNVNCISDKTALLKLHYCGEHASSLLLARSLANWLACVNGSQQFFLLLLLLLPPILAISLHLPGRDGEQQKKLIGGVRQLGRQPGQGRNKSEVSWTLLQPRGRASARLMGPDRNVEFLYFFLPPPPFFSRLFSPLPSLQIQPRHPSPSPCPSSPRKLFRLHLIYRLNSSPTVQ